jgi:hypothetical protein
VRIVSGIVALVYLLVGVLIASNKDYFVNVNTLEEVISAILAVVLWPLLLLGVDLHLGNGGNDGNGGKTGAFFAAIRLGAARWFA